MISLLPHGRSAIGLDKVIESGDRSLLATGEVGCAASMLNAEDRLLPEAILELIGQAGAAGLGLQQRAQGATEKASGGMIVKVKTLEMLGRDHMPKKGDRIEISVEWGESFMKVFELSGEVRSLSSKEETLGRAVCTVMETE